MEGDPQNAGRGRDMKHTPEPWRITTHLSSDITHIVRRIDGEKHAVCIIRTNNAEEANANAARIVACVNACAGMDDPAAEIERLRDMEKNIAPILQTVRALAQQISGDKSIDQMTRLEALGLLMAIPAEKGTNP